MGPPYSDKIVTNDQNIKWQRAKQQTVKTTNGRTANGKIAKQTQYAQYGIRNTEYASRPT
jgi:hypothetical protein